jgi:hypothetical protein
MKIQEKSRRGESGSVAIMETEFSTGLGRVKAETLSGSDQVSQVRSGYGSSNWVKAFSLSRGDRVSRVRSGYGSGNRVKAFSLSRGDRVSQVKLG